MLFPNISPRMHLVAFALAAGATLPIVLAIRRLYRTRRMNKVLKDRLDTIEENQRKEEEKKAQKEEKKKESRTAGPDINKIMGYDFVREIEIKSSLTGKPQIQDEKKEWDEIDTPGMTTTRVTVSSSDDRKDEEDYRTNFEQPDTVVAGGGRPRTLPDKAKPTVEPAPQKSSEPEEDEEQKRLREQQEELERWQAQCFAADMDDAWSDEQTLQGVAKDYQQHSDIPEPEETGDPSGNPSAKESVTEMMTMWFSNTENKKDAERLAQETDEDMPDEIKEIIRKEEERKKKQDGQ